MIGPAKCPKCETAISQFDLREMIVGQRVTGPFFQGAAACCPSCGSVLGVMPEPNDFADLVAELVMKKLTAKPR